MRNDRAYNSTKLSETLEIIRKNYFEFKDSIENLEKEITKLESKNIIKDSTVFAEFKEKYLEKKILLINMENMMKELVDTLEYKNEELYTVLENTKDNFE